MDEALLTTDLPGLKKLRAGKVRDIYDLGESLLIVATDRLSAYDCILPTGIPDKGRILTALSDFWFDLLGASQPHHRLTTDPARMPGAAAAAARGLGGRAMLVRKARIVPVECVVRGYLAGSGWQEYRAAGRVCGVPLPAGLRQGDRLPEPIFTPATKAETGHDENVSFAEAARAVGEALAAKLRAASLAVYARARDHAAARGVIIADTKFEFGLLGEKLLLCDEVLTPDSSRFWPAEDWRPGAEQPSFDKQFVRDYLDSLTGWKRTPPAPPLPPEVAQRTREKYLEAYRRITGRPWS